MLPFTQFLTKSNLGGNLDGKHHLRIQIWSFSIGMCVQQVWTKACHTYAIKWPSIFCCLAPQYEHIIFDVSQHLYFSFAFLHLACPLEGEQVLDHLIGSPQRGKKYHLGVSKNRGGPPKWMVKIMENPIKMDDLGDTILFGNTHLNLNVSDFHREALHCFCYSQLTGSMGPNRYMYLHLDGCFFGVN